MYDRLQVSELTLHIICRFEDEFFQAIDCTDTDNQTQNHRKIYSEHNNTSDAGRRNACLRHYSIRFGHDLDL